MSASESLREPQALGKKFMEMFDTFTGRKNVKLLFTSMKDMSKNMKEVAAEVEKTNELIVKDTIQVVEAIQGLGVKSASEATHLQGGIDQLIGSLTRMTDLTDTQTWLLEELKNTDANSATTTKQGWEDLAAGLQLLSETGLKNDEVIENLKRLDSSLHDEKILNAIRGISDGLEDERADKDDDAVRGNLGEGVKPKEKGGFLDTIMDLLGMGGGKGLGMIGKLAGGLLKKLGPWVMAISAVFDFVEGFNNAAEIVGKDAKDLDMFDKVMAGLANVISGLTFGLIDAKAIYKYFSENMQGAFESVVGWLIETLSLGFISSGDAKEIAGGMYTDIIGGLRTGINEFTANFGKNVEEMWELFKDVVGQIPKKINEYVQFYFGTIKDILNIRSFDDAIDVVKNLYNTFMSIFSEDGFLGKIVKLIDKLAYLVTGGLAQKAASGLKDLGSYAADGAAGAWDSAKMWMSGEDDPSKVAPKIQPRYVRQVDTSPSSQALDVSKKRYEESMALSNKMMNPNITVNTPAPVMPQSQPTQRKKLNNIGLELGNSGAFD